MSTHKLTDDLEKEVKTKWAGWLLRGIFALAVVFLVVVSRELLAGPAQRIWAGASKDLIGAILGLTLLVIAVLVVIAIRLRNAKRNAVQVLIKRFTVKWDTKTLEPHCPVCGSELAHVGLPPTGIPTGSHFRCTRCRQGYRLVNDETREPITLYEAKAILSSNQSTKEPREERPPDKLEFEEFKPVPRGEYPERRTDRPFERLFPKRKGKPEAPVVKPDGVTAGGNDIELDETATRILMYLSNPQLRNIYAVEVGNKFDLGYPVLHDYLTLLGKAGLVETSKDSSPVCNLTPKGKEYVKQLFTKRARLEINAMTGPKSSDGESLSEDEQFILMLLADPNCTPFLDSLSMDLRMHPTKLEYHLTELIKRDYVVGNSFDEWGARRFELTHKGRRFVIENGLLL